MSERSKDEEEDDTSMEASGCMGGVSGLLSAILDVAIAFQIVVLVLVWIVGLAGMVCEWIHGDS